jgi:hypothetical protein
MNLEDYKIDELKDLCKKQGINPQGKKAELIARLEHFQSTKRQADIFAAGQLQTKWDHDELPRKLNTNSTSTQYFFQIKASNLSNYLSHGYLYPLALEESDIYLKENRGADIQSMFPGFIILSSNPLTSFENDDVLIELTLNDIQVDRIHESGLFACKQPIPISRLKTIFFKSTSTKTSVISSLSTFPDCFPPNKLCKILPDNLSKTVEVPLEEIKLPANDELQSWRQVLNIYDRILGAFAFIKNAGILLSERDSTIQEYTNGFMWLLNSVNALKELNNYKSNSFISRALNLDEIELNNGSRLLFKLMLERIYANETISFETATSIVSSVLASGLLKTEEQEDFKSIEKYFHDFAKLTTSFKALTQQEVFKKNLPAMSLLFVARFSNKSRQHTDKQAVRNYFINEDHGLSLPQVESILGLLGLYYGYSNLVKEDTNLRFSDKTFEQHARNFQSIKFKLADYFERLVIESAFRFSQTKHKSASYFEFLDWDPTNKEAWIKLSNTVSGAFEYADKSHVLFNHKILALHRVSKLEALVEKIQNSYPDKISHDSYLAAFVRKTFKLEKKHVIDILKTSRNDISIDELKDVMDLDARRK